MNFPLARTRVETQPKIGRRGAPRLRLSIPARLVSLYKRHRCVILDLSRTGARVALSAPLQPGDGAFLQCGELDHFGAVQRREAGTNGLEFDVPLRDEEVLAIRRYAEQLEESERREWREAARRWVQGED